MQPARVADEPMGNAGRAPLVAIVDDHPGARASTANLLENEGYRVLRFASGDEFLDTRFAFDPDCILLDLLMPGRNGLDVLRALATRLVRPPTLILSGHCDLELAVEAMKLGAADFIRKPCPTRHLLGAVAKLTVHVEQARELHCTDRQTILRVEALTGRQRQVLGCIVRGLPNKLIAWELKLSVRTVECYRAELLKRLGVRSIAEAIRIALAAGLDGE